MSRNDHFLASILRTMDESDRKVKAMTVDKVRSMRDSYQLMFETTAKAVPAVNIEDPGSAEHLAYMCKKCLTEFIPQGRIEKAMRWLGFIQGALIFRYNLTLSDIRGHSRKVEQPT